MRKLCFGAILLALALGLCACGLSGGNDGRTATVVNLTADLPFIEPLPPLADESSEFAVPAADFAVRLLQASVNASASREENLLISPLSVLAALSLTQSGASGETLAQMEAVLGMPLAQAEAYMQAFETDELKLANSVWFRADERFTVNEEFLQKAKSVYGAEVFEAVFDESTVRALNAWVEEKTDGMIGEILDEVPKEAVMYLVNALAFEAEWARNYRDYQVQEADFVCEDGTKKPVDMMYSEEWGYLQDEGASGFIKYYDGHNFAFVGLLPAEGLSVADYVASMDGERLAALLAEPQPVRVDVGLPRFETQSSLQMGDVLQMMGMAVPFDADVADFSGLGESTEGELYISRVLHKTFIDVNECGTRAAAATAVEVCDATSARVESPSKRVILDRPFVYMLVECTTNTPVFIGTMYDVE